MTSAILSTLSVVLFCVTCRQLVKTAMTPIPISRVDRPYARGAMLIDKTYKILAWGSLTGSFLLGLVMSFYQVYTQL